jgi:hypothetical protein
MKPEKLQQLKEQHPDLEFESVDGNVIVKEKKRGRWRAEFGNDYYCVTTLGHVCVNDERKNTYDNFLYQTGNYFKTEKEAKAYRQHLIDRQKVLDKMQLNNLHYADLTNDEFKTLLS